jgi:hypothetical protein
VRTASLNNGHSLSKLITFAAALLLFSASGCSLVFVNKASETSVHAIEHLDEETVPPKLNCTSSKAAPVIDTVVGAFQAVRTGYAIQSTNGDYVGQPISREADILLGAGLFALFVGSAIYGFDSTDQCSKLYDRLEVHRKDGERIELEQARLKILRLEAAAQARQSTAPTTTRNTGEAHATTPDIAPDTPQQNPPSDEAQDPRTTPTPAVAPGIQERLERAKRRQSEHSDTDIETDAAE